MSLQPVGQVGSAADVVPVQDWVVEDVADVDFGFHSLLEIKKGNPYGVGYPFKFCPPSLIPIESGRRNVVRLR